MGTTTPIKDKNELNKMKEYYIKEKYSPRNYLLIVFGINTGLRIGDILNIRWDDVLNRNKSEYKTHITIHEHKTGKVNTFLLNNSVKEALDNYKKYLKNALLGFIFRSNKGYDKPISRQQAYRIIKEAAKYAGCCDGISCHSLRKTFGYYAIKEGISPAIIMKIYNHSSFRITQRYLGIEQDEKDEVYMKVNL